MTQTQASFRQAFPDLKPQLDFVLAPRTYFKVGGPAEIYLETDVEAVVSQVCVWCEQHQVPLRVLGGASNVIVADEGVQGVVLHLTNAEFIVEDTSQAGLKKVTAGAGTKTAILVSQTVGAGLKGLEYFLGVPGTLGGAIFNNAHYLSDLISQHVERVKVIGVDGQSRWLDKAECDFGYDHSRFQSTSEVIVAAEFLLEQGNQVESQELIKEATVYRAQTQPLGMPSSGCIFQNVPNTPQLQERFPQFAERTHVPGGFLIDQAGMKGSRVGDIEVSQKHAAFFVNHGNGTAQQVEELVAKVKDSVKAQFGVELHEEVFYLR